MKTHTRKHWLLLAATCAVVAFFGVRCWRSENSDSPSRALPSPDGSRIIFSAQHAGRSCIGTVRSDGTDAKYRTLPQEKVGSPAYSSDGSSIVYQGSVGKGSCIFVAREDLTGIRQITKSPYLDVYPSFSSDGKRIVFARAYLHRPYSMGGWSWNDVDICIVNADGSGEKRLTREKFYGVSAPYFSPTNRFVVFGATPIKGKSSNERVYLLDLSTRRLRSLTDGSHTDYEAAFSPDGTRIVYISDSGYKPNAPGGYDVWTMNLQGKNVTRLTSLAKQITFPYFTPDGKGIIFVVDLQDANGGELWRMDADGKNARRIAKANGFSR